MNENDLKIILSLKSKKGREKHNLFLIEGSRLIKSALLKPPIIKVVYFTETFKENNSLLLKSIVNQNILCEKFSNKDLKKVSSTINPSGVIALCLISKGESLSFNQSKWIYLDKISDPGNLGTLLRSASWFNFKNIALSKGCVDPFNPKVVRASMGAVFDLSIHIEVELKKFSNNYLIIGTNQYGLNINSFTKPNKFVIIIGNESNGISKENLNEINQMITIKKLGKGESLNAGTAGSIVMYKLSN
jgi:TrmH family RNA methyltransferase